MIKSLDVETGEYWFHQDGSTTQTLAPEGQQRKLLYRFIQNWTVMIDGGAWVGGWARHWSWKFKKVIAIEIDPLNYECLVKNINGFTNITAINACLADRMNETRGFEGDKELKSCIRRTMPDGSVPTLTIDSLELPECGFIKLDLQGYDYFALKGAAETISRCKPVVMFEHDPSCYERYGVGRNDPADWLKSLGMTYKDCLRKDPIWGWNGS